MAPRIPSSRESALIEIDGPAFSSRAGRYPFFEVSKLVIRAVTIVEHCAYLSLADPQTGELPRKLKVNVEVSFPEEGSYVQELFVSALQFVQTHPTPLLTALFAGEAIKRANDILALIKHLQGLRRKDKKPEVVKSEGNEILIGATGEKALAFNRDALSGLGLTVNELQAIMKQLNPDALQSIRIRGADGSELNIDCRDRGLGTPSDIKSLKPIVEELQSEANHAKKALPESTKPMSLTGRVRALDFDRRTGRFQAVGNSTVPDGTYDFVLASDQSVDSIRDIMGEDRVLMVCTVSRARKKIKTLHAQSIRRGLQSASAEV